MWQILTNTTLMVSVKTGNNGEVVLKLEKFKSSKFILIRSTKHKLNWMLKMKKSDHSKVY